MAHTVGPASNPPPPDPPQGCIREGTSEAGPPVVRQAVGGLPKRLGAVTVGYKCH